MKEKIKNFIIQGRQKGSPSGTPCANMREVDKVLLISLGIVEDK